MLSLFARSLSTCLLLAFRKHEQTKKLPATHMSCIAVSLWPRVCSERHKLPATLMYHIHFYEYSRTQVQILKTKEATLGVTEMKKAESSVLKIQI